MAFTAGFSVNVGDPTKASDVDVLAANDDYLKNAIDTFIANDANNRVLTATGSGTANAESNLTFDGSTLTVTGTVSATTLSGNVTGGTISGTTGTFTSTISTSGGYVTVSGNPSAGTISTNGNGQIGGLTGNGLFAYGKGSTYDLALANGNTSVALAIPTGGSATPNVYIPNALGIGTDSPKDTLHVKLGTNLNWQFGYPNNSVTTLAALNDAESAYVTARIDAGTLELNGQSGGDVNLGGGVLVVDASADRVGINTSSPNAPLAVASTASTYEGMELITPAGDGSGKFQFGVHQSGSTAGRGIEFRRGGSDGFDTLSLAIDNAGNMGLGVVPSTWSGRTALEIEGASTGYVTSPNGPIAIGSNIYYNGGDKFVGNGYAPLYALSSGNHIWYTSNNNTSGAGAAVTLTQAMTLTNAGLLGLGTSSPGEKLTVIGGGSTTSTANFTGGAAANDNATLASDYSMYYQIDANNTVGSRRYEWRVGGKGYSDGTSLMTLTSAGLLGIGTSSPSALAHLYSNSSGSNTELRIEHNDASGTATAAMRFKRAGADFAYVGGAAIAISGASATDLGLTVPSGKNIVFATNSTERARIDASGDLLVLGGTIRTKNATNTQQYGAIYGSASEFSVNAGVNELGLYSAGAKAVTIDSSQNVGIGTSSPTYKLVVSNGGAAGYEFNVNGLNGGVNTVVYNRSTSAYVDSAHFVDNYYIYSGQTPAERFRVESTGVCAFMTPNINIRFNGTATQSVLTNNDGVEIYTGGYIWAGRQAASLYLNRAGTTGDIAVFYYNNTTAVGSISVTSSATAYNTSSDYRLKENLVPITGAVDRVNSLQPRRFNFISDPDTTVDGFVAHEVSPVVPESVSGEKDAVDEDGNPVYQGIDQSKLVPLLTAAIQELTARIEALEAA